MSRRFDYFVILAGMRTGSNFLERNLNAVPGLHCFGEVFNGYFIAHEGQNDFLGMTMRDRERDPLALIARMRADKPDDLVGFRLFHDHDPRVRAHVLADPACAKIVLMRNPVDSYVSFKLARATDQWVLTEADTKRDTGKIKFRPEQFLEQLEDYTSFLAEIRRGLQVSGQTAFELRYEDLQDLEVVQGLVRFLGSDHRLEDFERSLKKQNPQSTEQKVSNPDQMKAALAQLDPFGLDMTLSFEPTRGAAVPSYVASEPGALIFMPTPGGPAAEVKRWLESIGKTRTEMTQKDLRQWRKLTPGATSFTVLRHPVARAWAAFASKILPSDVSAFAETRAFLRETYRMPLPETWTVADPAPGFDTAEAQAVFLAFLHFVRANLQGQTSHRVLPLWASQLTIVQSFAGLAPPDLILREAGLAGALGDLARARGLTPDAYAARPLPGPMPLSAIWTPEIESAARAAYPRDYLFFGFADWQADA